jgi:hypothetical protein
MPAKAGTQGLLPLNSKDWIPACAGMTGTVAVGDRSTGSDSKVFNNDGI